VKAIQAWAVGSSLFEIDNTHPLRLLCGQLEHLGSAMKAETFRGITVFLQIVSGKGLPRVSGKNGPTARPSR
jgi:hypothetical protein